MISEDLLERGLTAAAGRYDVPPDAVEALRQDLAPRPQRRWHRPRLSRRTWVLSAAAALVGLVVLAIAVGGGNGPGSSGVETAGPAGPSAGVAGGGTSTSAGGVPAGVAGGRVAGSNGTSGPLFAPAVPAPAAGALDGAAAAGSAADNVHAGAPQSGKTTSGSGTTPSLVPGVAGAKVVKTGEMDLQVDKGEVAHTLDQLTAIATVESGYVADSHSNEGSDPSGSVTLRVPVASFEDAVHKVRALDHTVMSQQLSGQDVTGQYVDLKARIGALQATRASFERLLARATTIGETLAVQDRITEVQTQIEQLQGQLQVLDSQSSYGTLTVTVDQKLAPVAPPHQRSGMSKAFHRSVDRFVNGIEAIVGILGPLLLVLLLAAFALVVGRLGYRRLRRALV